MTTLCWHFNWLYFDFLSWFKDVKQNSKMWLNDFSWWSSFPPCAVRWECPTASSRARPVSADWSAGKLARLWRYAMLKPETDPTSPRSSKPSRTTSMSATRRSDVTGEAVCSVPSRQPESPSSREWRRVSWPRSRVDPTPTPAYRLCTPESCSIINFPHWLWK